MSKPIVAKYKTDKKTLLKNLTEIITELGYALTSANEDVGLITFETGMTMKSFGQIISINIADLDDRTKQISISGTFKSRKQVYDWGERAKIASEIVSRLNSLLGEDKLLEDTVESNINTEKSIRTILLTGFIGGTVVLVLYLGFNTFSDSDENVQESTADCLPSSITSHNLSGSTLTVHVYQLFNKCKVLCNTCYGNCS